MLRAGVLTTSIEWFPLLMQVCCFLAFALQAQSQLQQRKKDSHVNTHRLCMIISAGSQQLNSWG